MAEPQNPLERLLSLDDGVLLGDSMEVEGKSVYTNRPRVRGGQAGLQTDEVSNDVEPIEEPQPRKSEARQNTRTRERPEYTEEDVEDVDSEDEEVTAEEDGEDSVDDQDYETEDPDTEDDDAEDQGLYTVKIGGEEQEVTLDELRAGYQRNGDYTRKTQALAEERRLLEQRAHQISRHYTERLNLVKQLLTVNDPEAALLNTGNPEDRDEYYRQKANADQARTYLQGVERTIQEERNNKLRNEAMLLREAWPDVSTEKQQALAHGLEKYYGIRSGDDTSAFENHKIVLMAKDALAYRMAHEDAPNVTRKLKAKPRPNRSQAPKGKATKHEQNVRRLSTNLRKRGGKVKDAARLIAELGLAD